MCIIIYFTDFFIKKNYQYCKNNIAIFLITSLRFTLLMVHNVRHVYTWCGYSTTANVGERNGYYLCITFVWAVIGLR